MALTTKNAGDIVPGGSKEELMQVDEKMKVRVIRAFYVSGKPLKVDQIVDLPKFLAIEMIAARKVEEVKEKAEEQKQVKEPEKKTEAPADDKKKGGKSDAK